MITAKQILEKYSAVGKVDNKVVNVYENPTSSDYQEMERASKIERDRVYNLPFERIRFIADAKSQTVYVCDAYIATHMHMYRILKITRSNNWIVDGMAKVRGTSILVDKDTIFLTKNSYNWKFADNYLPGFSKIIDSLRDKYK